MAAFGALFANRYRRSLMNIRFKSKTVVDRVENLMKPVATGDLRGAGTSASLHRQLGKLTSSTTGVFGNLRNFLEIPQDALTTLNNLWT